MATSANSGKVVYGIQVLRGVASMLVVCRHVAKEVATVDPNTAFALGQCGVDIFFVISGFVIFLTGRNMAWGDFMRRRVARIVPLYWAVLAIGVAAMVASRGMTPYTVSNAIWSALFVPAYLAKGQIYPPVVVGWSLNFEAYFYLIFTLALILFPRRGPLVPVSLAICFGILLGPGGLNLIDKSQYPAALLLLPISLEFLAGMWLARLWMSGRQAPVWIVVAALVASAVWFVAAPLSGSYTILRPLYWGVPAVATVWAVLMLERRIAFRTWKPMLVLGDASYALYLVHVLVLPVVGKVVTRIVPDVPQVLMFGLLVMAALITGIAAHYWVELPMLKVSNRLLGLGKKTSAAATDSAHLAQSGTAS